MDNNINYYLSIVTICLNDIEGIKKTFRSISNQKNIEFTKIEWIIKDGDSEDGSVGFIKNLIHKSVFQIKLITGKDIGIYDAMNIGLKHSNGNYVQFLNANDTYFDNKSLAKLIRVIKTGGNFKIIYGGHEDIFSNGKSIIKKPRDLKYLKWSLPTSHQAILYNRNCINDIKYDTVYEISADFQFTAEIDSKYPSMESHKIDEPIIKFFVGGLSTNLKKQILIDCFNIQRKVLSRSLLFASADFIRRWMSLLIFHNFTKAYGFLRKVLY